MRLLVVGAPLLTDMTVIRAAITTAQRNGYPSRVTDLISINELGASALSVQWAHENALPVTVVSSRAFVARYGQTKAAVARNEEAFKLASHVLIILLHGSDRCNRWVGLSNRFGIPRFVYCAAGVPALEGRVSCDDRDYVL